MSDSKTLVLGCGRNPKPGCVNLDAVAMPGVNVVFDLNWLVTLPEGYAPSFAGMLPFDPDTFDRVDAEDVLEHVVDLVAVVNECWRVLKPGGILFVRGPSYKHPEIVWADPTHRRAFAPRTFDNWDRSKHDGKQYGYYIHKGVYFFRVVKVEEVSCNYEYTLVKEVG